MDPIPHPHRTRRRWLLSLAGIALVTAGCREDLPDEASVSLDAARAELQAGRAILIDIREPDEHATGVVAGARLLPLGELPKRMSEIPKDPAQPVLLICHTQGRSSATFRSLREQGYGNVRFVQGGMSEWARRGWPMVRPGG